MISLGILNSPVELIEGQIIEMVPQEPPHAATTDEGGDYLKALFSGKAKVRAQLPVTLSPDSEPEPDFAIVRMNAHRYRNRHPEADDIYLVMEVAYLNLQRDRQYKTKLYAKAGIAEYWIINLQQNQVLVYRKPHNGHYQSEQVFTASDRIAPEAFPDIKVDLSQLLILE